VRVSLLIAVHLPPDACCARAGKPGRLAQRSIVHEEI
jgi:hypothetical protein